jgi:hypothetical protein
MFYVACDTEPQESGSLRSGTVWQFSMYNATGLRPACMNDKFKCEILYV